MLRSRSKLIFPGEEKGEGREGGGDQGERAGRQISRGVAGGEVLTLCSLLTEYVCWCEGGWAKKACGAQGEASSQVCKVGGEDKHSHILLLVFLLFEGGGQPEEAHHCHLPLFVDQEERQGVKILRLCLKFLATFSVYCKIASGRIHCVFCTNNQHYWIISRQTWSNKMYFVLQQLKKVSVHKYCDKAYELCVAVFETFCLIQQALITNHFQNLAKWWQYMQSLWSPCSRLLFTFSLLHEPGIILFIHSWPHI